MVLSKGWHLLDGPQLGRTLGRWSLVGEGTVYMVLSWVGHLVDGPQLERALGRWSLVEEGTWQMVLNWGGHLVDGPSNINQGGHLADGSQLGRALGRWSLSGESTWQMVLSWGEHLADGLIIAGRALGRWSNNSWEGTWEMGLLTITGRALNQKVYQYHHKVHPNPNPKVGANTHKMSLMGTGICKTISFQGQVFFLKVYSLGLLYTTHSTTQGTTQWFICILYEKSYM